MSKHVAPVTINGVVVPEAFADVPTPCKVRVAPLLVESKTELFFRVLLAAAVFFSAALHLYVVFFLDGEDG